MSGLNPIKIIIMIIKFLKKKRRNAHLPHVGHEIKRRILGCRGRGRGGDAGGQGRVDAGKGAERCAMNGGNISVTEWRDLKI